MRAAIYARTAVRDDIQIEKQIASCRKYASEQSWEVVNVYADSGKAESSMSREGMQALMREAAAGKFEIVLATDMQRLSRDFSDLLHICDAMKAAGVQPVTLTRPFSHETPHDRLTNNLIAAAASYEAAFQPDEPDVVMDEERARELLGACIQADNGLSERGAHIQADNEFSGRLEYLAWDTDRLDATLDGRFTADELEAIAWWMRSRFKPTSV